MYTCILSFIRTIIHTVVFLLNTYIQSIWHIHRCLLLPKVGARHPIQHSKKKNSFTFFLSFSIIPATFFELVIDFISTLLQGQGCKSKGTWRKFNHANLFHCAIYVPHIFISGCRHVYRISQVKKKHPLCFSNAVLGILDGDSVSFRFGGSVLGLRVHHSVRCNYEKLIPGRPVWHFIHDVSYGYLMHSSRTVQSHTYEGAHTFCQH